MSKSCENCGAPLNFDLTCDYCNTRQNEKPIMATIAPEQKKNTSQNTGRYVGYLIIFLFLCISGGMLCVSVPPPPTIVAMPVKTIVPVKITIITPVKKEKERVSFIGIYEAIEKIVIKFKREKEKIAAIKRKKEIARIHQQQVDEVRMRNAEKIASMRRARGINITAQQVIDRQNINRALAKI